MEVVGLSDRMVDMVASVGGLMEALEDMADSGEGRTEDMVDLVEDLTGVTEGLEDTEDLADTEDLVGDLMAATEASEDMVDLEVMVASEDMEASEVMEAASAGKRGGGVQWCVMSVLSGVSMGGPRPAATTSAVLEGISAVLTSVSTLRYANHLSRLF